VILRKSRPPRKINHGKAREAVIANRYFPIEEYEDRWTRTDALMEQRGIETAVVWGCDRAEIITHSPLFRW